MYINQCNTSISLVNVTRITVMRCPDPLLLASNYKLPRPTLYKHFLNETNLGLLALPRHVTNPLKCNVVKQQVKPVFSDFFMLH